MNPGCYRVVKELLLRNWVALPADSVVVLLKVEVLPSTDWKYLYHILLENGTTTTFTATDREAMSRLLEPL